MGGDRESGRVEDGVGRRGRGKRRVEELVAEEQGRIEEG